MDEPIPSHVEEAILSGDTERLATALREGFDPSGDRFEAIKLAAEHGKLDCLRMLIPVSDVRHDGSAALLRAAREGHTECTKELIPLSDPASCDALSKAAEYGHVECVRLLVGVSGKDAASSALRWAAHGGHAECVSLILPHTNPKSGGSIALQWAVLGRNAECIRLLLPVSDSRRAIMKLKERDDDEGARLLESIVQETRLKAKANLPSPQKRATI